MHHAGVIFALCISFNGTLDRRILYQAIEFIVQLDLVEVRTQRLTNFATDGISNCKNLFEFAKFGNPFGGGLRANTWNAWQVVTTFTHQGC